MKRFSGTRYVLIARDPAGKRLAACGTPRSLTDLKGLHRSLLALYPAAQSIDVVFPPVAGEKLDEMEPIVCANRCEDEPVGGAILWHRERDLRDIEDQAQRDRDTMLIERARAAMAQAVKDVIERDLPDELAVDQGEQGEVEVAQ